jgi:NitT/TauT family transport system ATP-binding protein
MPYLEIEGLCKTYKLLDDHVQPVFENFSLTAESGKVIAIIGVNGSGKTTLLKCLAGLVGYERGKIKIADQNCERMSVGFVFQNYRGSLLPWLKNIDNVGCVIDKPGWSRQGKYHFIKSWAKECNIVLPWDCYPYQISGGQQQLLVLARELIDNPKLLLLDEPTASLDYEKKLLWRRQFEVLRKKNCTTTVVVSHDIEEAVYLADEIIILSGKPAKIFAHYQINFAHPRSPSLLQSEKFFEYSRIISQAFKKSAIEYL